MPAKEIEVRFKSTSDDAALQEFLLKMRDAKVTLQASGQAAQETTGAFGDMGRMAESAGRSLGGLAQGLLAFVGLRQLFADLKRGAEEFISEERALNGVVMMLAVYGNVKEEVRGKVNAFADAMEKEGVKTTTTLNLIREFAPVTKDLDNTLRAAKLALDIASTGIMNEGEAASVVRDLIADNPRGLTRAHKLLGIEAKTSQGALDELYNRFGHYTEQVQDHQKALDKFTAAWHSFWKMAASDVIDWFDTAYPYWKAFDKWSDDWANKYVWHKKNVEDLTKTLQHQIVWLQEQRNNIERTDPALHTYTQMISQAKQELSELGVQADKTKKKTDDVPSGAPKAGKGKLTEEQLAAVAKAAEERAKLEQKAVDDLAAAYVNLAKTEAQEALQHVKESGPNAVAAEQQAVVARQKVYQLERKELLDQEAEELKQENLTEEAKKAIVAKYGVELVDLHKKYDRDITAIWQAGATAREKVFKSEAQDEEKIQKDKETRELKGAKALADRVDKYQKLLEKDIKKMSHDELVDRLKTDKLIQNSATLTKQVREQAAKDAHDVEVALALDTAQQILGSLQTVVDGQSAAGKAISAAQHTLAMVMAFRSAFQGATGAMADTPGDVYTRIAAFVLALAEGMSAYQAIKKSAAGGYDIPSGVNPLVQLHAQEMVLPSDISNFIRRGVAAQGGGHNSTVSNITNSRHAGQTVIVNQGLLVGAESDAAWREVRRRLPKADRAYQRTLVGRQVTVIGSARRINP